MLIATAIFQTLLMIFFLISGVGKVSGLPTHVNTFNRLQLPQWFRVVTGLVQLIGATGLALGYFYSQWAMIASIWLVLTMIGAILAHLRIKDGFQQMMAAISLFSLTTTYFVLLAT